MARKQGRHCQGEYALKREASSRYIAKVGNLRENIHKQASIDSLDLTMMIPLHAYGWKRIGINPDQFQELYNAPREIEMR